MKRIEKTKGYAANNEVEKAKDQKKLLSLQRLRVSQ
jgi:hypothetical protein